MIDTQTGAVERWVAGDPASVAEHLPSRCPYPLTDAEVRAIEAAVLAANGPGDGA